jgi:thiamine biosynthesis lipoprotein
MKRREFIGSGVAVVLLGGCRSRAEEWRWKGVVFGGEASVVLRGREGSDLVEGWMRLVRRFEEVFSLWREDSALSRLNREGVLEEAPEELLELLLWSHDFHEKTGGLFDPTVEGYLQWLRAPEGRSEEEVLAAVGWGRVGVEGKRVSLEPGTMMSFNAVVQGWLTDRVVEYLLGEGVTEALVNTGEWRALGGAWEVEAEGRRLTLENRALAVSQGGGTRVGERGHIIVPSSGASAPLERTVMVTAPDARLADGLATVATLVGVEAVREMGFADVAAIWRAGL